MTAWTAVRTAWQNLTHQRSLGYVILFLGVFVALTATLSVRFLPIRPLEVGDVCHEDIASPKTQDFVDQEATQKAQEQASSAVATVYSLDPSKTQQATDALQQTFDGIQQIQGATDPSLAAHIADNLPLKLSGTSLNTLVQIPAMELNQLEMNCRVMLQTQILNNGVKAADLPKARQAIATLIAAVPTTTMAEPIAKASTELLQKAVVANLVPDLEQTALLQQRAMANIQSVKTVILRDQVIIRKGEVVTSQQKSILQSLGLSRNSLNLWGLLGSGLLVLLCMVVVILYLRQQQPAMTLDIKRLLLLSLVVTATAGVSRFLIHLSSTGPWSQAAGYWAPVATASMVIGVLLDVRLALVITGFLALLVGLYTGDVNHSVVALLTGAAGALAVSNVTKWSQMIRAGAIVWAVNMISILVLGMIRGDELKDLAINCLIFGGINGLSSGLLAIGAVPLLENLFGLTTHIKLLELCNPVEPLLQKLMREAPGTYHHSMIVANLAEAAAQAIGADALLTRVGAYYHDIGKTKRPIYFVENLLGQENPHDKINPRLSSHIIISHVTDGIEMGKQYHLPDQVIDFIWGHHGTGLVSYFYHKAVTGGGEPASEREFRHVGPKPNTKETAIVMLSDSLEASARAAGSLTPERIDDLVRQIVKKALDDGQLDDSDLSFKDLRTLMESFTRTLTNMYHARVEYPQEFGKEIPQTHSRRKLFSLPQ